MSHTNKPLFILGRYQLVHRSNEDFTRLEKAENHTPIAFIFLRGLAGLKTALACFAILQFLMSALGFSLYIIIGVACVFLFLIAFISWALLSSYQLSDTKNPDHLKNSAISSFDWACVSFLSTIGIFNTYLNHSNTFDNAFGQNFSLLIHAVIMVVGVPYFIYHLKHTLLK
ncbi:MAG: hypothetical protein Q4B88_02050 [Moraxella sp.]|nr:hypothetical protein [Moraxella sp.]